MEDGTAEQNITEPSFPPEDPQPPRPLPTNQNNTGSSAFSRPGFRQLQGGTAQRLQSSAGTTTGGSPAPLPPPVEGGESVKREETKSTSSLGLREDLLRNAVAFLNNSSVKTTPLTRKVAFLESKGLTQEEIKESLRRAEAIGSSTPSSAPLQASVSAPLASLPPQIQIREKIIQEKLPWGHWGVTLASPFIAAFLTYYLVSKFFAPKRDHLPLPPLEDKEKEREKELEKQKEDEKDKQIVKLKSDLSFLSEQVRQLSLTLQSQTLKLNSPAPTPLSTSSSSSSSTPPRDTELKPANSPENLTSMEEIAKLLREGKELPGIRKDINDLPQPSNQRPSPVGPSATPSKPWEKRRVERKEGIPKVTNPNLAPSSPWSPSTSSSTTASLMNNIKPLSPFVPTYFTPTPSFTPPSSEPKIQELKEESRVEEIDEKAKVVEETEVKENVD